MFGLGKIESIAIALVTSLAILVGVFMAGRWYEAQAVKVQVARDAERQAKILVAAEKAKWERKVITETKVEYVKEYIEKNPTSCAGQLVDPELIDNVLHHGTQ